MGFFFGVTADKTSSSILIYFLKAEVFDTHNEGIDWINVVLINL